MSKSFKQPPSPKVQAASLKPTQKLKTTDSTRNFTSGAKTVPQPKTSTRASFRFTDYIWVSTLWFGISYLWGGVNGVILPNLNSRFVDPNFKGTSLGVITALGMVVAIMVQPAAGALSDINRSVWGRRRPFILVGGVLVVIVLAGMATMVVFFGNWGMLLLFYLLLQFADNVVQGAYQGFIPDCVPPSRRAKASGAMGIAQIMGNVLGLAVATFLIDQGRSDIALLVIAGIFMATVLPTLFMIREEPLQSTGARPNGLKVILGTFKELKHHPEFVKFIISRLFVLTALATLTIFALYYLQDVMGKTEGTLTESYTMLGIVVIICSLISIMPAVWLSDRIGRKKLVIISCAIGAVGMLLLSSATNITEVVIYGSLIGFATGSFNSLDWALATDLLPEGAGGRFMGISNLAGAGSQALAALIGGSIRDGFNALGNTYFNVSNLGYTALFLLGAFFFILGIIFLRGINEPQRKG
jgi:MFS family permease